jgi:hypothetical protein
MTVTSADYARVVAEARAALNRGTGLEGPALGRVIDVVQDAANTLDSKGAATDVTLAAASAALEAELVTQMGLWDADGAGDSSATYTAALSALDPLRTAVTAAAAAAVVASTATVDDIATHVLDGRNS